MMYVAVVILSVLAIAAGGMLSAFTARRPRRLTAWLSAYLVLVVGVVQLGLAIGWHDLASPRAAVAGAAFALYNLGSAGVVFGTMAKTRIPQSLAVVKAGGFCIGFAMFALLYAVKDTRVSWVLAGFAALTLAVLVSMPIGLVLSGRRHRELNRH